MKTPVRIAVVLLWTVSLALAYWIGAKNGKGEREMAISLPNIPGDAPISSLPQRGPAENLRPPQTASEDPTPASKVETYVRKRQSEAPSEWETDRDGRPRRVADAIVDALDNSDPIERMSNFSEALKHLDASNVQDVLDAFEERPGDHTDDQEFSMFVFAWARIDGASAMTYIDENLDGWQSHRVAYSAMSGWANADPDGAENWARAKHEGPDNPYLIGVINGVAKTDLNRATELTESLPYGRIRGKAVDVLIDSYLKEGVDTTMAWASNLEEGVLKNGIVSRVAGRVARDDPFAAANWAVSLAEGEERNRAVASIASTWSRSQPLEAANYSLEIKDTDLRAEALGEVFERWARSDKEAAASWLTRNKDNTGMDQALYEYAERVRFQDPVGAMSWAASIRDETARHKLMEQVAEEWMERDPEAAQEFLNR